MPTTEKLFLRQTLALIKSAKNKKKRRTSVLLLYVLRSLNQCRCLPKAELNTKTNPNGHRSGGRLGSFWFSTRPSADTGTDYNQDFDYGTN